jgi:hypothetical protein
MGIHDATGLPSQYRPDPGLHFAGQPRLFRLLDSYPAALIETDQRSPGAGRVSPNPLLASLGLRHALSAIFDRRLSSAEELLTTEQHIVDIMMGYLRR